jgi:hypothetical protein
MRDSPIEPSRGRVLELDVAGVETRDASKIAAAVIGNASRERPESGLWGRRQARTRCGA